MSLRIFVIDRNESIRDSFQLHLEEQGHEVLTASEPAVCDVFRGHDCTRDRPCGHALFISYHFSGMNGLDFIERMQQKGCKGSVRHKILMSGDTTVIDMHRAHRLGCRVLQKPVNLTQVDAIIKEIEQTVPANETLMAI